ncbi:deoxyribodipyrimidine photolyase [Candidatus Endobugula sertula]|uniref:Deoxyribodipyrimidine photo-lyase n=1 Tax=Candidatus Endobugula sertula TaxID=62101 RepID=A0A1D2QP70_9GAMM|nr:deoxyribodipyrimidine photolyase [Candidatus Endobugula sertula]
MPKPINIHWFRQDLRLYDNPALTAACASGHVLPIYILDDDNAGEFAMGGANRWWLHHSLQSLNKRLKGRLRLYRGEAQSILKRLVQEHPIQAVYWNRCYEPWRIVRDKSIKGRLEALGVSVKSFNGSLLWEPWQVLKKDRTPYRVFTPFYRRGCLGSSPPREPLPESKLRISTGDFGGVSLEDLSLLPRIPWHQQLEAHWTIGEAGAQARLRDFIHEGLNDYKEGRNFPAKGNTSRLSPHLHFGEISPNQVWHVVKRSGDGDNEDCLLSELGWREFSYSLLYHFPALPHKNWQDKFDRFPWSRAKKALQKWQRGMTGYPIVDAGMRELWQTGTMHNRVRMIVGSFLVKNLLLHWHHGEAWFWDCLVDADLASNSASWQWVAGCGADAAPYFRIFNPITQGEKFDLKGIYTRRFVPELAGLPDKFLYKPWEAPSEVLKAAGIKLGITYPRPIIDLKTSRERALAAYKSL